MLDAGLGAQVLLSQDRGLVSGAGADFQDFLTKDD
jgi:hypothetical protein